MRLHSPEYQRRLKRAAKKTIRESPELRKEYRRVRKSRRRILSPWVFLIATTPFFIAIMFVLRQKDAHLQTLLAWISIWTLASVLFRSQSLRGALFLDRDVIALRLLPVSDILIFKHQFRKWLLQFSKTLLDVFIAYGILGYFYKVSPWIWPIVPLLAIVTWLSMLSLTLLYFTRTPRRLSQNLFFFSFSVVMIGFAAFIYFIKAGSIIPPYVEHAASLINLLLPTGWSPSLFQLLLDLRQWTYLWLLLPVGLVILTLKRSIAILRESSNYRESILAEVPDMVPGAATGVRPGEPIRHVGLTEIEELVQSRTFLELTPQAPRPWLERKLWQWLTPRQRVLCDFAFPDGYAITYPALKFVRNMAVIIGAAFCTARLYADFRIPFVLIIFGVASVYVLARFAESGRAFGSFMNGGMRIPAYAHFGISFWELTGFLIKAMSVQFLVYSPLLSLIGVLFALWARLSLVAGFIFGLKMGILLFAGRLILLAFAFSGGTNDTSRFRLAAVTFIIVFCGLGFAYLGLSIAGLLVPHPALAWLFCLLAAADGFAMLGFYGWYYGWSRFDLMSAVR